MAPMPKAKKKTTKEVLETKVRGDVTLRDAIAAVFKSGGDPEKPKAKKKAI